MFFKQAGGSGPGFTSVVRMRRDPLGYPIEVTRQYGNFVKFPVGYGGQPIYLVQDPELLERVFVSDRDKYMKDVMIRRLTGVFGNGILVSDGDTWKKSRRLMAPAFHRRAIESYADSMVRATERSVERLREQPLCAINREMMRLALDIALESLFGSELGNRAEVIGEALDEVLVYVDHQLHSLVPVPRWLPHRARSRYDRANARIRSIVEEIIAERHAADEQRSDLLGMLLAARDEDGSAMDDRQVADEVVTLLLAGHETTALWMTWTLYELGQHPAVQSIARQEVRSVLGDRAPTVADLPELSYMTNVLEESLRLRPPAAITGREAAVDTELGGERIGAGAQIITSMYAMHRDPRFFDHPHVFDPTRWTPELRKSLPRFAFFPFGGGNRRCIGEAFARLEARILLAVLLQNFEFVATADAPPVPHVSITMRPRDDLFMRVREVNG